MKSVLISKVEEDLRLNPNLKIAITELISKSLDCKQNIIPYLTNEIYHLLLIENNIVRDYKKTHYQINFSLLFGQVAYHYFKEKLELPEIDSYSSFKYFLNKIKEFEENDTNRMGVRAVTKNLEPYLCIWLNHNTGYEFDFILNITSKEEYQSSWSEIHPIQEVFKYLIISSEKIVYFIKHCIELKAFDGDWYKSIKELCVERKKEAWGLLEMAKKNDFENQFLIANILEAISNWDFEGAFAEAKKLENELVFKKAALICLSLLKFPTEVSIEQALKIADEHKFIHSREVARIYGAIVMAKNCNPTQREKCFENWQILAEGKDADVKHDILWQLSSMEGYEFRIAQFLKDYYLTGDEKELSYCHDIDHLLFRFKNIDAVFSIIEHFVQTFPKIEVPKVFDSTITRMPSEVLSVWITSWLNEDRFIFNVKAGELVRSLSPRRKCTPLNKDLLDRVNFKDVQFIAYKIMGFVVNHEALTTLVFSILQRNPEDEQINELVESVFLEYILFNYKSPLNFLKEKRKTGLKIERKIAGRILKEYESQNQKFKDLPILKELQIPASRVESYMKRQAKKYNLEDSIRKGSVFMQLAKNIELRAGKGFFSRVEDNTYSEVAYLSDYRIDFELPVGEFIDPTGQAVFRAFCQSYKRLK
jgi:hypothetical protein